MITIHFQIKYKNMEPGTIIHRFQSKKGKQVVFRYPKESDLEAMLAYINELIREDTFVEMSGQELTREEEQKFLDETIRQMKNNEKCMVVVEINGKYVGSGAIVRQTYRKRHVGIVGLSLAKPVRNEGIGTELLKTLIAEAKKMNLRLLNLNCFENNTGACYVYEKIGFKRTGFTPEAILFKGKYVGEVNFSMPITEN